MPRVNKSFPGMYNGVSQQDDVTRLDTQCAVMENSHVTIVDGCSKRPPTEFIKVLSSTNIDALTKFHSYKRDEVEQYILGFTGDATDPIEVYDLLGVKQTVGYQDNDARDYAVTATPRSDLKMVTVADFTFVVNTKQIVSFTSALSPAPDKPFALMWVKEGVRTTKYRIELNRDPDTENSTFQPDTDKKASTDNIAKQLSDDISSAYDVDRIANGSVVRIERSSDDDEFTVLVSDGRGNTALKILQQTAAEFNNLPPNARDGDILEIVGDDRDRYSGLFFKWDESDGVWRETIAPGITFQLDAETMPHKLVRNAGGDFTFSRIGWEDRAVGNTVSIPNPSFVGETISNVFFFKNRLGFTTLDNVVMSRSGDFFNFFGESATDILDDDPIDNSIAVNQIAIIKHTLPFNDNLLLFSEFQQFSLGSRGALTPFSTTITPSTAFEVDPDVQPVGAGPNAYFISPKDSFVALREYFVDEEAVGNDAADVSAHVPQFIPKNTLEIVSNSNQELLAILNEDDRTELFMYKYFWAGNEKPQSAWGKWTFGNDVLSANWFDSSLYFIVKKGSEITLERLEMDVQDEGSLAFKILLDRQTALTGVFDSGTNVTTWTLPYADADTNFTVIRLDNGMEISSVTKPTATTVTAPGDQSSFQAMVGKEYKQLYQLNKWFIKAGEDKSILEGRLSVKRLIVRYKDTGFFQVEVTPSGRPTTIVKFTGRRLGVVLINEPRIETAEEKFIIFAESRGSTIELTNDSYLPSSFQSYALVGRYSARSQAI